ncbi:hypothetical protein CK203_045660 [Vitis vinifera]|uniref:Uncharacterized protein n=1 Tax=Vitis vinifera TaxID=29760 RepID=A0A438HQ39_VITVI|nr:hypothetical protein CK203_045660 [Vitis vinifera]
MRLRVKNLMQERNNEDLYNHIFNDDDILDEWILEGEEPILSSDNLDWLDKGLPPNEEGKEIVHEDDGAINHRVSRHTSNAAQERDIDSRRKSKTLRTIYSSSSSDDDDNGGSRRGGTSGGNRGIGGTGDGIGGDGSIGGGYVSQVDPTCHGHKEMKITMPHKIQIMDINQGHGINESN